MRNTILKKIKPVHSKNNSNYNKNNVYINNKKIKSNDSNTNSNSNNDFLITDNNIIDNEEDNFLTLERENNDNYNINMDKIRALSNNLNNININNQYIFINKDKALFNLNNSPKKINDKKEMIININGSNNHLNIPNEKIFQKSIKDNFINIKKHKIIKNRKCEKKILISNIIKGKINNNKDSKKKINKSIELENSLNLNNKNIKNNDDSYTSLNEINTIKDDESADSDISFEKSINKIRKKKIEEEIEKKIQMILKEDKIGNKCKENNNIKKHIDLNGKKRNIKNNRNMKMFEEEKTIIYKNEKGNSKDIKIMNYFQKLIEKHNENIKIEINQELKKINTNKNENNHFNNNNYIINSEKKIISQNIDIFHNNAFLKNENLSKKFEQKKTKGNKKKNNMNNLEKNEANKNHKKHNNIINNNNNILNEKKGIKINTISKKKLNEKIINYKHNNNEEETKKNISNKSINNMNLKNIKISKKDTKTSTDFSNKKSELKQKNINIYLKSLKKSNILLINNTKGNNKNSKNKSEEKINTNSNKNLKKIVRIKSVEKKPKTNLNSKESTLNKKNINNLNNIVNYQFTTKKNKTYFVSNDGAKVFNNSSNNIHKLQKNEINKNNNTKNNIKKINNKNNNNVEISNYINIDTFPQLKKYLYINNKNESMNSFRITDNYIKRSISPNANNSSFYSKIQSNKLIMNKKTKQSNNNEKKEFNLNGNNKEHKNFFKNEERKNNMNMRYSNNINNTETYFYLNDTNFDLSKSTKNKNNYLFNSNNCFTYTKGNRHLSPINTYKTQRIFSSFCSKINNKENKDMNDLNTTYKFIKRTSAVLKNNKNFYKKSKMKINIDKILNINFSSSIHRNKFQANLLSNDKENIQTLSNKKKYNNYMKKNISTNSSFIDFQIPLVPEENVHVISLKTMKYNQFVNSNQLIFYKIKKILRNDKIMNIIIFYLTNVDIFNLSLVNKLCYKITIKKILKIIMNKIIIGNEKLVEKIWNIELLKYSNFHCKKNFDTIYKRYIKYSNKYDNDITKDLLRTFPNDSSFHKGSECYKKLFNILKAYSNYNNEIGYAQGMNFIVAKIIIFFKNENKSFIYLDSLFNKLNMESVIGVSNNLENKMKILQFLLKKLCPDIIKYLERKKINHEIFTASWFITLFSKNFKYDNILIIIWNFSIIFGWKFIFLFSVSVIIIFKDKYFDLDLYGFTQYMKNIFIFEYFKNKFNDVMKLTFYYMSQWKNILKDIKIDYSEEVNYKKKENVIQNINNKDHKEFFFKSLNQYIIEKQVEDTETNYIFP